MSRTSRSTSRKDADASHLATDTRQLGAEISEQRMNELVGVLRSAEATMRIMSDGARAVSITSRRSILEAQVSLGRVERRPLG